MSAATVEQILQQIDSLHEDERRVLEERLATRAESEWQQAARQVARQRSIDQATIDQVVEAVRWNVVEK